MNAASQNLNPLVAVKVRLTAQASVLFWSKLSDDNVCTGEAKRLPRGVYAYLIGGTLKRPLVQTFYQGAERYSWLMPGDFTRCLHPMHDDDCSHKCDEPEGPPS